MIQKSEQQDIDRQGRRLLRQAVEPLGWVLNGFDEDYGFDYDVQVFANGSPDGLWFKIQLKSSASPTRSADATFLSLQLDIDHAKHYALEVRDPVFIVHADVEAGKVLWYAPQLDNELLRKLIAGQNSSAVTLRVPTSNLLPDTADKLLDTVNTVYVVLGHRMLVNSPLSSFANSLKYQPGEEEVRRGFQVRSDLLKFRLIKELFEKRQYSEARSRAQIIVSDPDSAIENRFLAQDTLGAIEWAQAVSTDQSQPQLPVILLRNAEKLRQISKRGPSHLKLFSLIAMKAAELDQLAIENWGLTILLRQHRTRAGNPVMALGAYAAHALSTRAVIKKYNQCLRLARCASDFHGRWFLPRALAKIPQAAASFIVRIGRMEESQMGEAGVEFQSSVLQVCKLIAWIGEESGDETEIVLGIGSAMLPIRSTDTNAFKWAIMTLDRIGDRAVKADATLLIERNMARWKGEHVEGDYNPEPYQQLLENAAASIGLDTSNKNSILFKNLQIAARDNSPERILRTCEHMVTSLGATGPAARQIAALLGTQMAGSKLIHCALHYYHLEGRDFDSAFAEFKAKYCDACADRAPRPPGWEYTDAAREEFEAKHYEFVKRFNETGAGFRFTTSD